MAKDGKEHITLIGPVYPYRGGIAHFLQTMYHGLRARGYTVSAITFKRQYPELLFPGKTQYETTDVPDALHAPRLLDTLNPVSWLRTARFLAKQRPAVLLFKYWMPFFAPAFGTVARYLRRRGIRTIAVVDNALPHERRPGDVALSKYFLRACDGLLVMSAAVEQDLATLGVSAPIQRIVHPVYDIFGEPVPTTTARTRLGIPEEVPVLLFFGFIRRYKGLQVLLKSMPQILARLPDAHLLVAGEFYDAEGPYHELIAQEGLKERVHLHADYIPNEEVTYYFSAADVIVQPYLSATQSGVAQIAYHFGKPVIVTDVGGLAEIVPDGKAGLVVPPDDPEALAGAVIRYFEEDMQGRLTAGVHAEKQKYSWDRLYEALEALMQGWK